MCALVQLCPDDEVDSHVGIAECRITPIYLYVHNGHSTPTSKRTLHPKVEVGNITQAGSFLFV